MQVSGSVLICDSINQTGIDILKKAGMKVDYKPNILTDELLSIVKDYQVILVRSRTKITREVIQAASNAKIIARAGVGLDNIEVTAAED
ncbi:MAG TPA: 3-phosphoglycerate dehydrogenase, partial [Nitrososphaeraceae archaeon]|nr:3-phosphoglycerate dehydrogenase [Nitrososphaeraceae archaeon]